MLKKIDLLLILTFFIFSILAAQDHASADQRLVWSELRNSLWIAQDDQASLGSFYLTDTEQWFNVSGTDEQPIEWQLVDGDLILTSAVGERRGVTSFQIAAFSKNQRQIRSSTGLFYRQEPLKESIDGVWRFPSQGRAPAAQSIQIQFIAFNRKGGTVVGENSLFSFLAQYQYDVSKSWKLTSSIAIYLKSQLIDRKAIDGALQELVDADFLLATNQHIYIFSEQRLKSVLDTVLDLH